MIEVDPETKEMLKQLVSYTELVFPYIYTCSNRCWSLQDFANISNLQVVDVMATATGYPPRGH